MTKPITYIADQARVLAATAVTANDDRKHDLTSGVREFNVMLEHAGDTGQKVIVIGNGGSAAIALHMAEDLIKTRGVRALAPLGGPLLTCIGNDLGFERVFSTSVGIFADPGDVLVAISSSGESVNIVLAAKEAKERACAVVTFTGRNCGNHLRKLGDLNFYVPSQSYGQVENAHATLIHCVLDCV